MKTLKITTDKRIDQLQSMLNLLESEGIQFELEMTSSAIARAMQKPAQMKVLKELFGTKPKPTVQPTKPTEPKPVVKRKRSPNKPKVEEKK